jgi:glucosamine kinase
VTVLRVGVDGGATKCMVRVEDASGALLGQAASGPANIRISVDGTWRSIQHALDIILKPHGIDWHDSNHLFYAGMGLAGCEMQEAVSQFIQQAPANFKTLKVVSDAHTACLGAHLGEDGSIIIAGTGSVGFQLQQGKETRVGGWGFPQDDQGSGAWIGLQAFNATLRWLDGRLPENDLVKTIFAHFSNDKGQLIAWSNQANSTAFATLVPLVVTQYQAGHPLAVSILQQAASAIDSIGAALYRAQLPNTAPLPCSLVGGVAPFLEPLLCEALRGRVRPLQAAPEVGALTLIAHDLC